MKSSQDPIPWACLGTRSDAVARPLVAWLDADGPQASVRTDAVLALDLAFWPLGDGAFDEPTPLVGAVRISGAMPGMNDAGLQVVYPPSGLAEPEVTCVPRTIGLGTGALAAWAVQGDVMRFYEINPQIEEVAREHFTFLQDCRGTTEVIMGDARLMMEREEPQRYDILVLDAFSGANAA